MLSLRIEDVSFIETSRGLLDEIEGIHIMDNVSMIWYNNGDKELIPLVHIYRIVLKND